MPALIKPGHTKIITRDGEVQVSITLDLNINLNGDGLQVTATAAQIAAQKEEDDVNWAIPDFSSEKVNFGKKGK